MQRALRAQTTYATHRPRVGINVLYLVTLPFRTCAQQYGGDPESASIKAWLATVRPAPTPLHYSLTQLYPLATNFTTQVPRRDHSVCVCVVEFVVVVWPRCSCTALHCSGGTADWRASLRTSNIQQARLQPCSRQEGSRCVVAGHTARDSVRRCVFYCALQEEVLMQTTCLPHVCSDTRGGPMLSTWPQLRTALAPTQATSHTRARRMAWYEQFVCVRV